MIVRDAQSARVFAAAWKGRGERTRWILRGAIRDLRMVGSILRSSDRYGARQIKDNRAAVRALEEALEAAE